MTVTIECRGLNNRPIAFQRLSVADLSEAISAAYSLLSEVDASSFRITAKSRTLYDSTVPD